MSSSTTKIATARRGAVVVLVAVSLIAIFGLAALAVDGGRMVRERRHAQAAADMAAEAAGIELYANYAREQGRDTSGAARLSALAVAASNGYPSQRVTVNIPPTSGEFVGKHGYAEVIIDSQVERSISNLLGSGNLTVKARAVAAGAMVSSYASVVVLDPKRKDSLRLNGSSSSLQVAGDIIVNSMDKRAVRVNKKTQIVADNLLVSGGLDKKIKGLIDADVVTGVPPTPDPLAALAAPPKGIKQSIKEHLTVVDSQSVYDLPPGNYSELKFDKNDAVILQPGIYYVDGEIAFRGSSKLSGNRVLIYTAAKKGIKFHSRGSMSLTPPTSGPYAGITIMQEASSKTRLEFKKDGSIGITGVIYAPNSEVIFKDADLEISEDWEEDGDNYFIEEDGGISAYGSLGASLICRKLTIAKGALIRLQGADVSSTRPLQGLVE